MLHHLGAGGEAGCGGGGMTEHRHGIAGVGPIDHQEPEVGQGVAQRAQLPVEDGPHLAVVVEHDVVHAVVAVHDRRALLRWDPACQFVTDPLDRPAVVDAFHAHLGRTGRSTA